MAVKSITFDFGTAVDKLGQKKRVRRQSWSQFDYLINTTSNKGDEIFVKIIDGGEKDTYYNSDEYKGSTEDFTASDWEVAKNSNTKKFVVGITSADFYIDDQSSTTLKYVRSNTDVWYEDITYENIKTAFSSYLPNSKRHEKETNDNS